MKPQIPPSERERLIEELTAPLPRVTGDEALFARDATTDIPDVSKSPPFVILKARIDGRTFLGCEATIYGDAHTWALAIGQALHLSLEFPGATFGVFARDASGALACREWWKDGARV